MPVSFPIEPVWDLSSKVIDGKYELILLRMAYSSSFSDQEWEIIEPLLIEVLPPKKQTRPPKWTKQEILDSILYQLKNGIKRHLTLDTLGFPFFTLCPSANVSDNAGLIERLSQNSDYFRAKPVNIPKITVLLDHGYDPKHLAREREKVYPQIMRKIKFERSAKLSQPEKVAQGKAGFIPAVARSVVERANAWVERCKILVKNYERTLPNATAKLNLRFIRLMVKRLMVKRLTANI